MKHFEGENQPLFLTLLHICTAHDDPRKEGNYACGMVKKQSGLVKDFKCERDMKEVSVMLGAAAVALLQYGGKAEEAFCICQAFMIQLMLTLWQGRIMTSGYLMSRNFETIECKHGIFGQS
jgi:hypothetical protein